MFYFDSDECWRQAHLVDNADYACQDFSKIGAFWELTQYMQLDDDSRIFEFLTANGPPMKPATPFVIDMVRHAASCAAEKHRAAAHAAAAALEADDISKWPLPGESPEGVNAAGGGVNEAASASTSTPAYLHPSAASAGDWQVAKQAAKAQLTPNPKRILPHDDSTSSSGKNSGVPTQKPDVKPLDIDEEESQATDATSVTGSEAPANELLGMMKKMEKRLETHQEENKESMQRMKDHYENKLEAIQTAIWESSKLASKQLSARRHADTKGGTHGDKKRARAEAHALAQVVAFALAVAFAFAFCFCGYFCFCYDY